MRAANDRITRRVALGVEAEVALLDHPRTVLAAETLEVGPAGAQFLLDVPLPVGTAVRFRCVIPGRTEPVAIDVEATIEASSDVLAEPAILARDAYRHRADFAPMSTAAEAAIVAAMLFIETRRP